MLAEASERGAGCPEGRTSQKPAGEEAWGSCPGPGRRTRSRVMRGGHRRGTVGGNAGLRARSPASSSAPGPQAARGAEGSE